MKILRPGSDGSLLEKTSARSLRAWVAIRTLNDPAAILKLRAAFPESKPQQAASTGLFHRVSLDMAAEAVACAPDVAQGPPRQPQPSLATSAEPARKPVRQRVTTAARRRTATGGRQRVEADLVLVGA